MNWNLEIVSEKNGNIKKDKGKSYIVCTAVGEK